MSTTSEAHGRERVLVVDDEPQILRALRIALRGAGYAVIEADSCGNALRRVSERSPDVIVLDLMLPDGDGLEVCHSVRQISRLPIIVLSAIGDEQEKVRALDAGADDYVTKPFGTDELLARVRAVLRRAAGTDGPVVVGDLAIDLTARTVTLAGAEVHLTPTEFSLLSILAREQGRLVTHRTLLKEVWGAAYTQDTHYLRVHFANLRAKIEPAPSRPRYIRNEPGVGYRLAADS
jgi:two-component system KDP operon response regulator KdpE